jgi:hypothetical protein
VEASALADSRRDWSSDCEDRLLGTARCGVEVGARWGAMRSNIEAGGGFLRGAGRREAVELELVAELENGKSESFEAN